MAVRDRIHLWALQDGLILVLVVGSACAIGGVHTPTTLVLGGLASIFALIALFSRRFGRQWENPPALFWCLVVAGLWAVVQSLPLGGLAGVGSMGQSWQMAGVSPSRLSGNFPVTLLMAVRCLVAALLLWGAYRYFGRPQRVNRLIIVVIASGTLLTALALAQEWLGSDSVLFFYEAQMGPVRAGLRGPFVNPDHYGAYVSLAALLALGRGLTLVFQRVRYLYHGLFVFLFSGLLLSVSFSALFGFFVGLVLLAVLWRRHRGNLGDVFSLSVPLMGLAVVLVLLFFQIGLYPAVPSAVMDQVANWSRVGEIWSGCLRVIGAHAWVGVGSGGLTDSLTRYLEAPVLSVWFARNQAIQSLVDFGVPVGTVLLVGLLLSTRYLVRIWHPDHQHIALPIAACLWGLAAQAMTDFVLEIPALGIAGALLLGALVSLTHRYQQSVPEPQGRSGQRPLSRLWFRMGSRILVTTLVLLSILTGLWCLGVQGRYEKAVDALDVSLQAVPTGFQDPGDATETALDLLRFRPRWGRIYTRVGEHLLEVDHPEEAREWLVKASQLLVNDAYTMRLLGTVGLRLNRNEEAIAHLARSMSLDPEQIPGIMWDLVGLTADMKVWLAVAQDELAQEQLIQSLHAQGRHFEVLSLCTHLLEDNARSLPGLEGAAGAASALGLGTLSSYYAQYLLREDPDNLVANLIIADQEWSRGNLDAAMERLDQAALSHPDDSRIWFALGARLLERHADDTGSEDFRSRMEEVISNLRLLIISQPRYAASFYTLIVRYYRAIHNWRALGNSARQGIEVAGDQVFFQEMLAQALEELGDEQGANAARERALQIRGRTPSAGQEAPCPPENVEEQDTRPDGGQER